MSNDTELRSEIAEKMSLDRIRYSQVWEDHELLEEGLQIDADDDILSICSAGCNVLALLLKAPRSVTAIDMNPAQISLLELKLAAISELEHSEFIELLGVRPSLKRRAFYEVVRGVLTPMTRRFWDANVDDIEQGVIQCGRLESYFHGFQTRHLPHVWPANLFERLRQTASLEEQVRLLTHVGLTPQFEDEFRSYFGRDTMAAQGRDPAQFEHVDTSDVGLYFYERFVNACTTLPLATNFYVAHFLTGRYFDLDVGPPYLRQTNFNELKGLLHRVDLKVCELEQVLHASRVGRFSKANLSDIFEYMSASLSDAVFQALGERIRDGGRIAYWNLLVPRRSPEHLSDKFDHLSELSQRLWSRDRSWFYRAFHVERIHR